MPATVRAVLSRPSGIEDRCDVPVEGDGLPMPPQFVFFENRLFERANYADQHDQDGRIHAYRHRTYVTPVR
jgi:hypothetical protein